ncbi:hypothetical protein ACOME3_000534 [Neoechinorhynchus agilis]
MLGMISACYQHSTLDQLHTAILSRVRAKLPDLPATVNNVEMGNVPDFLQIPPIRTKDKQAIVEVMTLFGCSRHDGWGVTLNLNLEDVSIESLFSQFRSSFTRTDLDQYLDLTAPMSQSNVAVVAVTTVFHRVWSIIYYGEKLKIIFIAADNAKAYQAFVKKNCDLGWDLHGRRSLPRHR